MSNPPEKKLFFRRVLVGAGAYLGAIVAFVLLALFYERCSEPDTGTRAMLGDCQSQDIDPADFEVLRTFEADETGVVDLGEGRAKLQVHAPLGVRTTVAMAHRQQKNMRADGRDYYEVEGVELVFFDAEAPYYEPDPNTESTTCDINTVWLTDDVARLPKLLVPYSDQVVRGCHVIFQEHKAGGALLSEDFGDKGLILSTSGSGYYYCMSGYESHSPASAGMVHNVVHGALSAGREYVRETGSEDADPLAVGLLLAVGELLFVLIVVVIFLVAIRPVWRRLGGRILPERHRASVMLQVLENRRAIAWLKLARGLSQVHLQFGWTWVLRMGEGCLQRCRRASGLAYKLNEPVPDGFKTNLEVDSASAELELVGLRLYEDKMVVTVDVDAGSSMVVARPQIYQAFIKKSRWLVIANVHLVFSVVSLAVYPHANVFSFGAWLGGVVVAPYLLLAFLPYAELRRVSLVMSNGLIVQARLPVDHGVALIAWAQNLLMPMAGVSPLLPSDTREDAPDALPLAAPMEHSADTGTAGPGEHPEEPRRLEDKSVPLDQHDTALEGPGGLTSDSEEQGNGAEAGGGA